MRSGSGGPPPLLIVEDDRSLRSLFTDLLTEEGYTLAFASSLGEAELLVEERTFALLLVDLCVGRAFLDLSQVRALCTRSYPVPLAVLTHLPLPDQVNQMDVAFVLPMPFDIEACLSLIATTIQTPLNAEQRAQGAGRPTVRPPALVALHTTENVPNIPL